jgi:hypothetical protein
VETDIGGDDERLKAWQPVVSYDVPVPVTITGRPIW